MKLKKPTLPKAQLLRQDHHKVSRLFPEGYHVEISKRNSSPTGESPKVKFHKTRVKTRGSINSLEISLTSRTTASSKWSLLHHHGSKSPQARHLSEAVGIRHEFSKSAATIRQNMANKQDSKRCCHIWCSCCSASVYWLWHQYFSVHWSWE